MFRYALSTSARLSRGVVRSAEPKLVRNRRFFQSSIAFRTEAAENAAKESSPTPTAETVVGERSKRAFKAHTARILEIVTNSLYQQQDVFIRELVSNASDALEKLRFGQLNKEHELTDGPSELSIHINVDKENHTLTIADCGIGMNEEELIDNLGTIASSGTKAFLEKLKENGKSADVDVIGQFGVGFYSVFMVADKVQVFTKSCQPGSKGYVWESNGVGEFEIAEAENVQRGSKIVIHLKPDAYRFADDYTVRSVLNRYSNFVPFPVYVNNDRVNNIQPLWVKQKNEVTDEQHTEFYRFISHAFDQPLYKLQFSTDSPLSVKSVFYVGEFQAEKVGMGEARPGLSVYSKRVLIEAHTSSLVAHWLRFVKGVVDCDDLPLNISRETLQANPTVRALGQVVTKRLIKWIKDEAARDPETYNNKFWHEYANNIRQGIMEDRANQTDIAQLLRMDSSAFVPGEGKKIDHMRGQVSLDDYVKRMPEDQKSIYYLVAPTRHLAEQSVYYEAFKKKGIEVLFLYHEADDFVMHHLGAYKGKEITSIESGEVNDAVVDSSATSSHLTPAQEGELIDFLKHALAGRASVVRVTKRLHESPALILDEDGGSASHRRMMTMLNRRHLSDTAMSPQTFEINPNHPILIKLHAIHTSEPDLAKAVANQLFDNALISAGLLDDPRSILPRINDIVLRALSSHEKPHSPHSHASKPAEAATTDSKL